MLDIPSSKTIFAVSDTHFRTGSESSSLDDFVLFLEYVRKNGDVLFLLGDILDFYLEYPSLLQKSYFPIFHELKKTEESNIEIHYWTGNHDFWLGKFVREIGIKIHNAPEIISTGKGRLLVLHGDETESSFSMKHFMGGEIQRKLFSLLHPEIGISIASKISSVSRNFSGDKVPDANRITAFAEDFFKEGIKEILMGHFHRPYFYSSGKNSLYILGDWETYRSFGIISDGTISMNRFIHSPR